jgi:iron complex transport system permease protein
MGAGGSFLTSLGLGGDLLIATAAALGAAVTLLIILAAATRVDSSLSLLILGVMFGALTSAVVSLLMHFSIPERIQAFVNWTFGSFNGVTWGQMPILAAGVTVGLILALALRKSLNALLLGEAYAASMGLNTTAARAVMIGATALLAGIVTAFCGPIGFIGTAVPHVCRALFNSSDHGTLVPACALMGGLVGLAAALLAELPGSNLVLPLNAVTAALGAPVVIYILLRQRNLGKAFGG